MSVTEQAAMKQVLLNEMGNGHCFVCGAKSAVGLKLDFNLDGSNQSATCEAVLSGDYCGWAGFVHGGIIASMLDGAMVYACKSIGLDCMTAELTIRYKKPVPVNKQIKICAHVQNRRTRANCAVIYTEAVMEINDTIVNIAKAKMFVDQEGLGLA